MKRSLPYLILGMLMMLVPLFSEAQVYTITNSALNVGNPGGVRTAGDATTTGGTVIQAYNNGTSSTNLWSDPYAIPFTFDFYGSPVTHLMVSKNGLLSFDTTNTGQTLPVGLNTNTALPNASLPNKTIAYFWDDVATTLSSGDNVYAIVEGTAPNRQLFILNYSYYMSTSSFNYFAVVLEETSNKIYVVDMSYALSPTAISATVGIQVDATTAFEVSTPLNGTMGSPNIQFGPGSSGNTDNEFYEFSFLPAGSCFPPTGVMASALTPTTGTVSWTSGGAANSLIEYGPTGFALGSGTQLYVSSTSSGISGLSPNTTYDVYVKDSCATNASTFVGPVSFTTPCAAAMNGVYSINSASPTGGTNFNSFADAAAELNACGITGSVVINVNEGTYTEQFSLDSIAGASASNTVTIQPAASNTMPVIVTYGATGSADNYVLKFNGAIYTTVKGLTLTATGTTYAYVVGFEGNCDNVVLEDNILNGIPSTTTSSNNAVVYNSSSSSDVLSNVTIKNNEINNGSYGIYWYGVSSAYEMNNSLDSNTIQDFYYYGIYSYYQDGITFNGNTITQNQVSPYSTGYGIYNNYGDNSQVIGNTIAMYGTSNNYGLYNYYCDATAPSPNLLANNMISCIGNSGTTYGIYAYNNYYTDIVYNSINLTGGSTTAGRGIYLNSSTSGTYGFVNLLNNNVVNTGGGYAVEVSSGAVTLGYVTSSDYNNIYATGATLVRVNNSNYADLAAYQMAVPTFDQNSVSAAPLFVSPDDLHAASPSLNNAGSAYAGITADIDGEMRSATMPDIGADEFTPPSCLPSSGLMAVTLYADSAIVAWNPGTGTTYNIEYGATGFTQGLGTTVTGIVDTFYTITGLTATTSYDFYIVNDCGASGLSPAAGPASFTTACGAIVAPHIESFNTTSLPNCWSTYSSGTETFNFGSNTYGPSSDHTGGSSYYANVDDSESPSSSDVTLESPLFDVSGLTNPELKFYLASADATVTVTVDVWDGTTWNIAVFSHAAATVATWDPETVNLTPYASGGTIAVRFVVDENNGTFQNDIGIDDVEIHSGPTCPAPAALGVTNVTTTAADVYWIPGGAANFNVQYGSAGFSLGMGSMVNAANDTLTLSGLTSGSQYEFYVRDSCGVGDVSAWAGPFAFNTSICSAASACTYQVHLMDTYGDAWNGGEVTIYQNGLPLKVFTYTPVNGGQNDTLKIDSLSLCDNVTTVVTISNLGSFSTEMGLQIFDPSNILAGSHTAASGLSAGDTLFSFNASCVAPSCLPPSALGVAGVTETTASVYFTPGGSNYWNVEYGPAGFTLGSGTTMAAVNDTVMITGLTANTTYEFYVQDSCGAGNLSSWTGPVSFTTLCAVVPLPYLETFEIGSSPTLACVFAQANWALAAVGGYNTSSNSLTFPFYSVNGGTFSAFTPVLMPTTSNYELKFDHAKAAYTTEADSIKIYYSTDGGSNYTLLVGLDGSATGALNTVGSTSGSFVPALAADWSTFSIALPVGVNQIRIDAVSAYGNNLYIDNLSVAQSQACPAPTGLGASNITTASADLHWISGGAASWNVEYGPTAFTLGNGTLVAASNDTLALTGLTAQTCYDFYVQDVCGPDSSAWVGPLNFCTAAASGCSPFTSSIPSDTLCAPGFTSFTTTAAGNSIVYIDPISGLITAAGDTLRIVNNNDTTVTLNEAIPSANTGHVGPLTNIAAAGYGNFSNGQWISVLDTVRIDSMTVNANGPVQAHVQIWTNDPGINGTLVQLGESFTTGATPGDYQVPVGVILTPGTYFMNVNFTGGTGSLFRATGGAVYPYVLPGLLSIDSTNFSAQTRIYYTFDLVVTEMCLGSAVSATSYIQGLSAGSDVSVILCDNGTTEDLTNFLTSDADLGGSFVTSNASAGLSGNMLNPTLLSIGTYQVYYTTAATPDCPSDSSLITVTVEACTSCVGLTAPTLTPDTICGPGTATLGATTSATDIVWYNQANEIVNYGTTFSATINATTQFNAQSILSAGPTIVAGPPQSLSVNAYPTANFSNGQYITVAQDVRIDSAVFAVNGALDFVVAIQDAQRTDTLQVSKLISMGSADTAAKEIGLYLTPGVYFISVIPQSGPGILWRPTAGANFPYGVSNILTVDSSDFGPTRLYYLYEMKVSGACVGPMASVSAAIASGSNPGQSDSVTVCAANNAVDLSSFLGAFDAGGTWYDDDATGALTANIFDATAVTPGTFNFTYAIASSGGCPADSATITATVVPVPNTGPDSTGAVCITQGVVQLRNYITGNKTAGTWTQVGGTGQLSGSFFQVTNATAGTTYTFRYVISSVACPDDTAMVTLSVDTTVTAGNDINITICDSSSSVDLTTMLDAGASAGGTFVDVSGSGGLTGSIFNATAVTTGQTYEVRYLLNSACGDDSASIFIQIDNCVGLGEYGAASVNVYPNPTSGIVKIENLNEGNRNTIIEVFAINGQLLMKHETDGGNTEVDLSGFADGIYNVKITTDNGVDVHRIHKK